MTEDWREGGFGVYVHWPFCAAKCPYCDFNSHVSASVDHDRWSRALISEIRATAAEVPDRTITSVYFGGGTPSLMPPQTVAKVLDAVGGVWHLPETAEITLEANPTSVEADRFRGYRAAGVNRVSLGVQALDDAALRALGRQHSVAEARAAFAVARATFDRVSFDLIYARQHQSVAAWRAELHQALDMAVDHLSLYQLTIELGTRFGALAARNRLRGLPDISAAAEMFEVTREICAAFGLPGYEVSNHARVGAVSRHNLVYWRYGDYAGIGPGAHGRLTSGGCRWATETHLDPDTWLTAVEHAGTGVSSRNQLDRSDQAIELMLMGMRLDEGVELARYERLAGEPLTRERLAELSRSGMIVEDRSRLRTTKAGRLLLNKVLETLLI